MLTLSVSVNPCLFPQRTQGSAGPHLIDLISWIAIAMHNALIQLTGLASQHKDIVSIADCTLKGSLFSPLLPRSVLNPP